MNKIDNSDDFCPNGRLASRMFEVNNRIIHALNQRIKNDIGVSLAKYDVLYEIKNSAYDYITMGELSRKLFVSNANMTGMTTRLQADGLVVKKTLPSDRRVYCIALTDLGHEMLQKSNEKMDIWLKEIMSGVECDEINQMHSILDKMDKKIKAFSQK